MFCDFDSGAVEVVHLVCIAPIGQLLLLLLETSAGETCSGRQLGQDSAGSGFPASARCGTFWQYLCLTACFLAQSMSGCKSVTGAIEKED